MAASPSDFLIDDLTQPHPIAAKGRAWRFVADTVMGGISSGSIGRSEVDGKTALTLQGNVSLENNGGFIQMALPLAEAGRTFDASQASGIELTVLGNNQDYSLHLRTDALDRPWQSYRQTFTAKPTWRTIRLPFEDFDAYRTEHALDLRRLVRLGVVAIGREFEANLALSRISFYNG